MCWEHREHGRSFQKEGVSRIGWAFYMRWKSNIQPLGRHSYCPGSSSRKSTLCWHLRGGTSETQREVSSTIHQLIHGLGKRDTDQRKDMEKRNSAETGPALTKNVPQPRSLPLPAAVNRFQVISPAQYCETRAPPGFLRTLSVLIFYESMPYPEVVRNNTLCLIVEKSLVIWINLIDYLHTGEYTNNGTHLVPNLGKKNSQSHS